MSKSPSPFDPKSYYRFSNAAYAGVTISTGYKHSSSFISLTPSGSRSSENWQIYHQTGRYLIRNYDYGAELQLGLTKASDAVPQLLPRSGELGQQWMLDQYEDGTWRLTNALLGNVSMLGVSDAISRQEIAPAMNPSPDESDRWIVTVNLSAGEIWQQEMLNEILGLEGFPSTALTIPSTPVASTVFSTAIASAITSTAAVIISVTAAASTITSTATTSSNCCGDLNTTTYVSQAQPMHSPPWFFTCTFTGIYFVVTTAVIFLVAAALVWRRQSRNSYDPVDVLDVDYKVKAPLTKI